MKAFWKIVLTILMLPPAASAENNLVIKHVTSNYSDSSRYTYKKSCYNDKRPIYGHRMNNTANGGDVLAGILIGGLLGKGLTRRDKGAAAGAILGGIIAADSKKKERVIVGYEPLRKCKTLRVPKVTQSENMRNYQKPTIKRGDRGELVRSIQRHLNIIADGIFGYSTELAVRNWQARNGLTPDGLVGKKTQLLLLGKRVNSTSLRNTQAMMRPNTRTPIYYNQLIGIFSESEPVRLDIGTRAMNENIPASHNSWATRFRIERLDGASRGTVFSHHTIGLFSETEPVRLDIGMRAMKENVPASHNSWATQLVIKRLDGPNRGPISYGEVVGVFSSDRNFRLDIGTRAVKEDVPSSYNSWGTRLRITPQ